MPYTDEQKAQALAVYENEGLAAAAKHLGCSKGSILLWAEKEGIEPPERSTEQTKAATEEHVRVMDEKRKATRADLADGARNLLARIAEEESPQKCQSLAVAAAILVDKWSVIGWGDGGVDTPTGNADLDRLRAEARARGEHLVSVPA